MKLASAIMAFGVLFSAAQPSVAQTVSQPSTVRTVKVAYADLDIHSQQGRATLQKRVNGALRTVCPRPHLPASVREMTSYRECATAAKQGAETQLAELFANRRLALNEISIGPSGR